MVKERISGTLAAAVTPLRDAGRRLDEDAFAGLLDFYGASGLDGLLVLGTTGEGILLGDEERRRVAEIAVAGGAGLRVIVHCGAQTTAHTCACDRRPPRRRRFRGVGAPTGTAVAGSAGGRAPHTA